MLVALAACSEETTAPDYGSAAELEAALNAGEDVTGKSVSFEVAEIVPDSSFGYNLICGEHLNFCSSQNPNVKVGDTVTAKITEVNSVLGSYIISYEKL